MKVVSLIVTIGAIGALLCGLWWGAAFLAWTAIQSWDEE